MMADAGLDATVQRAIALYNRTRSPEVTAKLVLISPALLIVSFTGGFCYGCGIQDYVEGFAEQFKALSGKYQLKVGKTREVNARVFEADFNVEWR